VVLASGWRGRCDAFRNRALHREQCYATTTVIRKTLPISLLLAVGLTALVCYPSDGSSDAAPRSSVARTAQGATYVAMGDSYSSGEGLAGAPPDRWLNSSGVPWTSNDGCDRSALSFSELVAKAEGDASSFRFVACSGVASGSIADKSSFTKGGSLLDGADREPSQLDALSPTDTKIVTLTIGGNDLGFSKVLAACMGVMAQYGPIRYVAKSAAPGASAAKCLNTLNQAIGVATSGPEVRPSLEGALIDTDTDILKAAPMATLYVLTYPQLLTEGAVSNFCPLTGALHVHGVSIYLGIDPAQVKEFNTLEDDLNTDIAQAAQTVNQTLVTNRIDVVDVNALTTDDGQTCNASTMSHSMINGVLFLSGQSLTKVYDECFHGSASLAPRCATSISAAGGNFIAKGSLHPKRAGQAVMAKAVIAAIAANSS
jgi:GDSL-like lipase/acylhydrolase family protein